MTRLPDPATSAAMLLGSSRFDHDDLTDLPAVTNNLVDLAAILTDPAGTGLPTTRCTVLADPGGVAEVGARLQESAERAEDMLLWYYAGHGVLDDNGELYLTLPGSNPYQLWSTALPLAKIREVLARARAKNRVLVLDCCFSGRAIDGFMSAASSVVSGQLDIDGTYTLTATPPNSLALAPPGATHTVFTGALVTVLREGIPDEQPLLTLGAVYRRLLWTFRGRGQPQPQQRGTRTADQLALAPNRSHPDAPPARSEVDDPGTLVAELTARFGPTHPDTLRARERQAEWLASTGDVALAARLRAALLTDRMSAGRSVRRAGPSGPS